MLEAEKEGDIEKANRILGEFEATHPGLLATRMHCEVFFIESYSFIGTCCKYSQ